MPVGPEEFKRALSRFASGVTIVAATAEGRHHGMTCTSFASASLRPPLVAAILENDSNTLGAVRESRAFAVSVLGAHQRELARLFALPGPKPFGRVPHRSSARGPLIEGAIAHIECALHGLSPAGDHHVVVGLVEACSAGGGEPLVYFERDYRRLVL